MRFKFRNMTLLFGVILMLACGSLSLANPVDLPVSGSDPEQPNARYIGSFFGFCNAEGKMCGSTSPNRKDCCGTLVCLLIPDQLGYYCMRDPTMPYLGGWLSDW